MEANPIPQSKDLIRELAFTASRSSGPGGQHVNKVSTKITLKWDVLHSSVLNDEQKYLIRKKLATRLTRDGFLLLSSSAGRSQLHNKEEVLSKLDHLLQRTLTPKKIRKATKPCKAAKRKRLTEKKIHAEKKQWRQKPV